ncbi:MAG TPA: insulinase family protein [Gemmatimonadaceae bacterium]
MITARTSTVLALALALLGAPAAAQLPGTPPAPAPLKPTKLPPLREATLPNGMRLLVVESHKLPTVALTLAMRAGDFTDPAGKEGLAGMTATLLTKGAGSRTAEQVSAAIEGAGGSLAAGTSADALTINASALSDSTALVFELLGDAVARPTFDQKEVDLAKTQTLSSLQLQNSQPATVANRVFNRELYGEGAYARSATPASVGSLSRDDVTRFYASRVKPRGALLVVSGDIDLATATRLATSAFKGWTGTPAALPAIGAPRPRTKNEIVLVHRPSSVQANVVVGGPTFAGTDPRIYALLVANRVLGGGGSSRLFQVLREQKSWTYGSYSSFTWNRGIGAFAATVEARNAVVDSALVEMLAQLRRLRDEPVPATEFASARDAIVGSFPLAIETAQQLGSSIARARLLGLPDDYVRMYRTRVAAVTPARAQAVVKQVIDPDKALIVVVGDATVLRDRLAKIAPVRVIRPDGTPVADAELAGPRPGTGIDVSKLVAAHDSFAVLVQGNPFGTSVRNVERTADGVKITEHSVLGPIMSQNTELLIGPDGAMRSVMQRGTVQGMETKIDAAYTSGHVKGAATTVGQAGPKSVSYDTSVVAGIIDDNAISSVVPTLAWAPGASFTLPVFASGEGVARSITLKVTGKQSVTVPAGTFDSYVVEMTGGPVPVNLYVTAAQPYRIVRTVPVGPPIEIVLVK